MAVSRSMGHDGGPVRTPPTKRGLQMSRICCVPAGWGSLTRFLRVTGNYRLVLENGHIMHVNSWTSSNGGVKSTSRCRMHRLKRYRTPRQSFRPRASRHMGYCCGFVRFEFFACHVAVGSSRAPEKHRNQRLKSSPGSHNLVPKASAKRSLRGDTRKCQDGGVQTSSSNATEPRLM